MSRVLVLLFPKGQRPHMLTAAFQQNHPLEQVMGLSQIDFLGSVYVFRVHFDVH